MTAKEGKHKVRPWRRVLYEKQHYPDDYVPGDDELPCFRTILVYISSSNNYSCLQITSWVIWT